MKAGRSPTVPSGAQTRNKKRVWSLPLALAVPPEFMRTPRLPPFEASQQLVNYTPEASSSGGNGTETCLPRISLSPVGGRPQSSRTPHPAPVNQAPSVTHSERRPRLRPGRPRRWASAPCTGHGGTLSATSRGGRGHRCPGRARAAPFCGACGGRGSLAGGSTSPPRASRSAPVKTN